MGQGLQNGHVMTQMATTGGNSSSWTCSLWQQEEDVHKLCTSARGYESRRKIGSCLAAIQVSKPLRPRGYGCATLLILANTQIFPGMEYWRLNRSPQGWAGCKVGHPLAWVRLCHAMLSPGPAVSCVRHSLGLQLDSERAVGGPITDSSSCATSQSTIRPLGDA